MNSFKEKIIDELIEKKILSVPLMEAFLPILRMHWKKIYDELEIAMWSWGEKEYIDKKADYYDMLFEMQQEREMRI